MDNGTPWGTQSKLPSALGLWLVGLGIDLVYGRPARSTDNAVVERTHGVLNGWVEPDQCSNFNDCQKRLSWALHTQRERYPLADGRTRCQAYPELRQNARRYTPANEAAQWDMAQVCDYLAGFRFQRKVEKNGRITLFANAYSVGRAYQRQYLTVQLDSRSRQWVISDDTGEEIRRHDAKELDDDLIQNLRLAKRRRN
jgi:hypothetical protein